MPADHLAGARADGHHAQKKSFRAVQRLRADIVGEREAFATWQEGIEGARVVCVDESGIATGTRLAYGYAPRGERCEEHAPYRLGRRTNLLGWTGLSGSRVVPHVGNIDADAFEAFVRDHLAPSLSGGEIVVWDNHVIHKRASVREMIEARGATLVWQPRYSPETNTCELMWAKVKRQIKRARADTKAALTAALDLAMASVSAADTAGWLRNCGYRITPDA